MDGLTLDLEHLHRLAILGTLAAGVAHEINNLLTPAIAYAQLAEARPDDPDLQAKAIRKSLDGAGAATGLASAILGLAHPDAAGGPARAEARRTVQRAADFILDRRGSFTIDIDVPTDLAVAMSPIALQQVVLNLLINAQHALGERGGRVTVTGRAADATWSEIIVSDEGPGLPADLRARLFQPFVHGCRGRGANGHNTPDISPDFNISSEPVGETERSGGMGLGLSICRHLVERAGGSIDLVDADSSRPNRPGTAFRIRLPLASSERAAAA